MGAEKNTAHSRRRDDDPRAQKIAELVFALKLARLHISGTQLEHAVLSFENPSIGLGSYLEAVIAKSK